MARRISLPSQHTSSRTPFSGAIEQHQGWATIYLGQEAEEDCDDWTG